jgi:hypothetical protein
MDAVSVLIHPQHCWRQTQGSVRQSLACVNMQSFEALVDAQVFANAVVMQLCSPQGFTFLSVCIPDRRLAQLVTSVKHGTRGAAADLLWRCHCVAANCATVNLQATR